MEDSEFVSVLRPGGGWLCVHVRCLAKGPQQGSGATGASFLVPSHVTASDGTLAWSAEGDTSDEAVYNDKKQFAGMLPADFWGDVTRALRGEEASSKKTPFTLDFEAQSGILTVKWMAPHKTFVFTPTFALTLAPHPRPRDIARESKAVLLQQRGALLAHKAALQAHRGELDKLREEAEADKAMARKRFQTQADDFATSVSVHLNKIKARARELIEHEEDKQREREELEDGDVMPSDEDEEHELDFDEDSSQQSQSLAMQSQESMHSQRPASQDLGGLKPAKRRKKAA